MYNPIFDDNKKKISVEFPKREPLFNQVQPKPFQINPIQTNPIQVDIQPLKTPKFLEVKEKNHLKIHDNNYFEEQRRVFRTGYNLGFEDGYKFSYGKGYCDGFNAGYRAAKLGL